MLTKLPVTVPSVVRLFAVVGSCDVLQHIPLAVMVPPPLFVILPPDVAVVNVMPVTAVVVNVGTNTAVVLKVTWFP